MKYATTYKTGDTLGLALDARDGELPITMRRVTEPQRDGLMYAVDRFSEGREASFRVSEVDLFGARDGLRLIELQWAGRLTDAESYIEQRVYENVRLRHARKVAV